MAVKDRPRALKYVVIVMEAVLLAGAVVLAVVIAQRWQELP